jgi:hypothetical protein
VGQENLSVRKSKGDAASSPFFAGAIVMDTHVANPTLEDVQPFQARLPGEPDGDSPSISAEPLRAGARTASAARTGKRRSGLLSGVAIVAIAVLAGGGFLVSPYNTVVPVPQPLKLEVAQLLAAHFGQAEQRPALPSRNVPTLPHLLAPSASLASSQPPEPPAPVVLPPYKPTPAQFEVAELENLQGSGAGQPAKAVPAARTKPAQVANQAVAPPTGYVPHEPGAGPEAGAPVTHPPVGGSVKTFAPADAVRVPPVVAKAETPSVAQLQRPAPTLAQQMTANPVSALAIAPKIEAAPLAPVEQVQVLELVTQLATLIRDERTQIANIRADEQNANKTTASKLSDFERRLALVEANAAMVSALNTPSSAAPLATPPATPPASATSVALMSARAALNQASQAVPPQPSTLASASGPVVPVVPELYRVQAASPGLAMLAEVDHSGGDGAQIEVQVGDTLPGYGRVQSVIQEGTAWVVKTDHGLIQ